MELDPEGNVEPITEQEEMFSLKIKKFDEYDEFLTQLLTTDMNC